MFHKNQAVASLVFMLCMFAAELHSLEISFPESIIGQCRTKRHRYILRRQGRSLCPVMPPPAVNSIVHLLLGPLSSVGMGG